MGSRAVVVLKAALIDEVRAAGSRAVTLELSPAQTLRSDSRSSLPR